MDKRKKLLTERRGHLLLPPPVHVDDYVVLLPALGEVDVAAGEIL